MDTGTLVHAHVVCMYVCLCVCLYGGHLCMYVTLCMWEPETLYKPQCQNIVSLNPSKSDHQTKETLPPALGFPVFPGRLLRRRKIGVLRFEVLVPNHQRISDDDCDAFDLRGLNLKTRASGSVTRSRLRNPKVTKDSFSTSSGP